MDIKNCPLCGIATFKDGGCNYMKCSKGDPPISNCPCEWCFVCGLQKYKPLPNGSDFCDDKTHDSH